MSVKDSLKHILRMFGHALVVSVHQRLATVEQRLDQLDTKLDRLSIHDVSLAETDGALLKGVIHIVETLNQEREHSSQLSVLLTRALDQTAQTEARLLAGFDERLEKQRSEAGALLASVGQLVTNAPSGPGNAERGHIYVETDDYAALNPEAALLNFLYSCTEARKALDVGAHVGDFSECLLNAGYEVYAFEPSDVFEKLNSRLADRKDFHPFRFALGSSEGEAELHLATDLSPQRYYEDPTLLSSMVMHSMPADIAYTRAVPVTVRTLADLHRTGVIPEDIGVAKIDTEGFDLEVIRGMGEHRYPVILAEYFDVQHPFGASGLLYTLESLVQEMRSRGYHWHIVIHHDWHCEQTGYYCNHAQAVPGTWGNVVFFYNQAIFAQAQSWCSAMLPHTYFRARKSH